MSDIFFITGHGRSGTTAIARILNTATNAEVFVEQPPKLTIESRQLYDGILKDPEKILFESKNQCIQEVLNKGLKYGDKNLTYVTFIPYLLKLWNCKIIFLIRDGRDVVRSSIDFHNLHSKNIYTMAEDEEGSPKTLPDHDPWDYSRLRPLPNDPVYSRWKQLPRFQKVAWKWSKINEIALNYLADVSQEKWMLVDMSSVTVDTIKELFDFLGLTGFDRELIDRMLNKKINSLFEKIKKQSEFPHWNQWDTRTIEEFNEFARDMMKKLGYKL